MRSSVKWAASIEVSMFVVPWADLQETEFCCARRDGNIDVTKRKGVVPAIREMSFKKVGLTKNYR